MDYALHPMGDSGVIIELGKDINVETMNKVRAVANFFDHTHFDWLIEYIPAFTTVTVLYHPLYFIQHSQDSRLPYHQVCDLIDQFLLDLNIGTASEPRVVEIPVCYGGDLGPDIENVASHNGLTIDEVIDLHANGDYVVYMIGFAPGFPYIGGMSEKIATPRRESPRLNIPAGTVGIAGKQTGVYPIETPGGWQLIGKTPIKLFRPGSSSPSLLKAGDKIKFTPITLKEFNEWEGTAND
ncbi:inhibitor of KinA [Pullulanibacillus pueri]|uniref:Kinase A inhibitor n=1 Tax=Pullulanibacillus pueri TaxID=1437324 RepID=A0A8J3EPC5_9BACL|nr:5-oxoprolinase subunit PxpB [Pullulanibacillus pueri]MBM7684098.1 inhibitor of KinA [Pullulanibacillus pueri]GGH88648.1 kinase A inhibitor [Pullulanibacillus pueri]